MHQFRANLFAFWIMRQSLSPVMRDENNEDTQKELTAWSFRRPWSNKSEEIANPVSSRSITNNRTTSCHNSSSDNPLFCRLWMPSARKRKIRRNTKAMTTRNEAMCCNQQSFVMSCCCSLDRKDASCEHVSLVKWEQREFNHDMSVSFVGRGSTSCSELLCPTDKTINIKRPLTPLLFFSLSVSDISSFSIPLLFLSVSLSLSDFLPLDDASLSYFLSISTLFVSFYLFFLSPFDEDMSRYNRDFVPHLKREIYYI